MRSCGICFKWLLLSGAALAVLGAEEATITLNTKKWQQLVSDRFVSFTLDPAALLLAGDVSWGSERSLTLARGLAPAYLRLAGIQSNHFHFLEKRDNHSLTENDWLLLNQFCRATGLRLVAALNVMERLDGVWDPRNSLELITYSDRMGFELDWQLGYELQRLEDKVDAHHLGRDVLTLRHILDAFPRYVQSGITAPDITMFRTREDVAFLKDFFDSAAPALTAVTWHPYLKMVGELNAGEDEDLSELYSNRMIHSDTLSLDKEALSRLLNRVAPRKSIWISESHQGRKQGKGTFGDALLWAKRLGKAARLGIQVVLRQPDMKGLLEPSPDYWVSLLHKRLLGREVLDTRMVTGNRSHVHVFCHCTHNQPGAVTLLGINLLPTKVRLSIKSAAWGRQSGGDKMVLHQYLLTEQEGQVLLNGQILQLGPDGELPMLIPKVRHVARVLNLSLAARAAVFWVLMDLRVRPCNGSHLNAELAERFEESPLVILRSKEGEFSLRHKLGMAFGSDDRGQSLWSRKRGKPVKHYPSPDHANGEEDEYHYAMTDLHEADGNWLNLNKKLVPNNNRQKSKLVPNLGDYEEYDEDMEGLSEEGAGKYLHGKKNKGKNTSSKYDLDIVKEDDDTGSFKDKIIKFNKNKRMLSENLFNSGLEFGDDYHYDEHNIHTQVSKEDSSGNVNIHKDLKYSVKPKDSLKAKRKVTPDNVREPLLEEWENLQLQEARRHSKINTGAEGYKSSSEDVNDEKQLFNEPMDEFGDTNNYRRLRLRVKDAKEHSNLDMSNADNIEAIWKIAQEKLMEKEKSTDRENVSDINIKTNNHERSNNGKSLHLNIQHHIDDDIHKTLERTDDQKKIKEREHYLKSKFVSMITQDKDLNINTLQFQNRSEQLVPEMLMNSLEGERSLVKRVRRLTDSGSYIIPGDTPVERSKWKLVKRRKTEQETSKIFPKHHWKNKAETKGKLFQMSLFELKKQGRLEDGHVSSGRIKETMNKDDTFPQDKVYLQESDDVSKKHNNDYDYVGKEDELYTHDYDDYEFGDSEDDKDEDTYDIGGDHYCHDAEEFYGKIETSTINGNKDVVNYGELWEADSLHNDGQEESLDFPDEHSDEDKIIHEVSPAEEQDHIAKTAADRLLKTYYEQTSNTDVSDEIEDYKELYDEAKERKVSASFLADRIDDHELFINRDTVKQRNTPNDNTDDNSGAVEYLFNNREGHPKTDSNVNGADRSFSHNRNNMDVYGGDTADLHLHYHKFEDIIKLNNSEEDVLNVRKSNRNWNGIATSKHKRHSPVDATLQTEPMVQTDLNWSDELTNQNSSPHKINLENDDEIGDGTLNVNNRPAFEYGRGMADGFIVASHNDEELSQGDQDGQINLDKLMAQIIEAIHYLGDDANPKLISIKTQDDLSDYDDDNEDKEEEDQIQCKKVKRKDSSETVTVQNDEDSETVTIQNYRSNESAVVQNDNTENVTVQNDRDRVNVSVQNDEVSETVTEINDADSETLSVQNYRELIANPKTVRDLYYRTETLVKEQYPKVKENDNNDEIVTTSQQERRVRGIETLEDSGEVAPPTMIENQEKQELGADSSLPINTDERYTETALHHGSEKEGKAGFITSNHLGKKTESGAKTVTQYEEDKEMSSRSINSKQYSREGEAKQDAASLVRYMNDKDAGPDPSEATIHDVEKREHKENTVVPKQEHAPGAGNSVPVTQTQKERTFNSEPAKVMRDMMKDAMDSITKDLVPNTIQQLSGKLTKDDILVDNDPIPASDSELNENDHEIYNEKTVKFHTPSLQKEKYTVSEILPKIFSHAIQTDVATEEKPIDAISISNNGQLEEKITRKFALQRKYKERLNALMDLLKFGPKRYRKCREISGYVDYHLSPEGRRDNILVQPINTAKGKNDIYSEVLLHDSSFDFIPDTNIVTRPSNIDVANHNDYTLVQDRVINYNNQYFDNDHASHIENTKFNGLTIDEPAVDDNSYESPIISHMEKLFPESDIMVIYPKVASIETEPEVERRIIYPEDDYENAEDDVNMMESYSEGDPWSQTISEDSQTSQLPITVVESSMLSVPNQNDKTILSESEDDLRLRNIHEYNDHFHGKHNSHFRARRFAKLPLYADDADTYLSWRNNIIHDVTQNKNVMSSSESYKPAMVTDKELEKAPHSSPVPLNDGSIEQFSHSWVHKIDDPSIKTNYKHTKVKKEFEVGKKNNNYYMNVNKYKYTKEDTPFKEETVETTLILPKVQQGALVDLLEEDPNIVILNGEPFSDIKSMILNPLKEEVLEKKLIRMPNFSQNTRVHLLEDDPNIITKNTMPSSESEVLKMFERLLSRDKRNSYGNAPKRNIRMKRSLEKSTEDATNKKLVMNSESVVLRPKGDFKSMSPTKHETVVKIPHKFVPSHISKVLEPDDGSTQYANVIEGKSDSIEIVVGVPQNKNDNSIHRKKYPMLNNNYHNSRHRKGYLQKQLYDHHVDNASKENEIITDYNYDTDSHEINYNSNQNLYKIMNKKLDTDASQSNKLSYDRIPNKENYNRMVSISNSNVSIEMTKNSNNSYQQNKTNDTTMKIYLEIGDNNETVSSHEFYFDETNDVNEAMVKKNKTENYSKFDNAMNDVNITKSRTLPKSKTGSNEFILNQGAGSQNVVKGNRNETLTNDGFDLNNSTNEMPTGNETFSYDTRDGNNSTTSMRFIKRMFKIVYDTIHKIF